MGLKTRDGRHFEIVAATHDRAGLVAELFESGRSTSTCWCMWFRKGAREFDAAGAERRRTDLIERLDIGPAPGLIAVAQDRPVGWLSFGPANEMEPRLRGWSVAPQSFADEAWVIVCLYVPRTSKTVLPDE